MRESFIALLLTVNSANLDNVNVERAFPTERQCLAWVAKQKPNGKLACVSHREFKLKRDEVFR